MFVTKKHLTRRTILRGAGAALALPLLDPTIPAGTALADTAANPTPHLGFIYFPHGAVQDKWTPNGVGKIESFNEILKPLEPYKSMTTVISNIENQAELRAPGDQPGPARRHDHRPDRGAAHWAGYAAAVAGSGDRDSRGRRFLRPRLRLLLRGNDFVPFTHDA